MTELSDVRPVLVGIDGSEPGLRAARWAAVEARRRHAPLRLVHVVLGLDDPWLLTAPGIGPGYRDTLLGMARARLGAAREAALGAAPGVDLEEELPAGDP